MNDFEKIFWLCFATAIALTLLDNRNFKTKTSK